MTQPETTSDWPAKWEPGEFRPFDWYWWRHRCGYAITATQTWQPNCPQCIADEPWEVRFGTGPVPQWAQDALQAPTADPTP